MTDDQILQGLKPTPEEIREFQIKLDELDELNPTELEKNTKLKIDKTELELINLVLSGNPILQTIIDIGKKFIYSQILIEELEPQYEMIKFLKDKWTKLI